MEKLMNIVKQMIKELSKNDKNGIYLREIALLMEEIDMLKDELRVKQNLIENYEKKIRGKNAKS
jgi:hypothetical protein